MDKLPEEVKNKLLGLKTEIDVSSLYEMCLCLEICTSRGGFKANELELVGKLYSTLLKEFNKSYNSVKETETINN